tara:strand:+ start:290 stop:712 length:423 start_codon:yes stop_codon:yes gene_type:complete
MAQDAVVAVPDTQVVHVSDGHLDFGTVGGGAGTVGGIVGLVLLFERVGLIRIPRRENERPAPQSTADTAAGHVPLVSVQTLQQQMAGLDARERERHDAQTREVSQLREDTQREVARLRDGIDRLADKLDTIAERIRRATE